MRKQIIFVADDFGMNSEVNAAILHSHRSGNLHATALMMGQSGTEEAVILARENPQLQIGWHLHLNDSNPVTISEWPWGASPARAGVEISLSEKKRALVRKEIARQWTLFQETGLSCHFVNCHHHLQAHPVIFQTLTETLGSDFKGWIRLGRVCSFAPQSFFDTSRMVDICFKRLRKLSTWRTTDTLWGLDRTFSMNAKEVREAVAALPEGFHEFLFHPRSLSCPDTQCLLELRSLQTD